MKGTVNQFRSSVRRSSFLASAVLAIWVLVAIGPDSGRAIALGAGAGSNAGAGLVAASPAVTCPSGQCFHDVTPSNPFYATINNLYLDNIISGYPCGGANEPCDADHRPYYRPGNNVTRGQMSKFVDNGRKNISDAIGLSLNLSNALSVSGATTITGPVTISSTGTALSVTGNSILADAIAHSLYISTTAGIAGDFETRSGGEGIYAACMQAGNNCYALEGYAPAGDYAGYMYGGKGVYAESDDAAQPGVDAEAYGAGAPALHAESALYRGAYIKSDSNTQYSLYVDDKDGPGQTTAALTVRGSIHGQGDLIMDGSKAGYVVDIMQNAGSETLEPGDVVTIVGNAAPVLGQIPLVTVKKATAGYDTGVAGVVDEAWYAPDPTTKAAYDKEQADWRAAMDQRNQLTDAARAAGTKPDLSKIVMPDMTITDEQGTLHALPGVTRIATGGYLSAVTLGSYKAVKVDAAYGPVHAGDLLTTSPHAGYAMKVTDKSQAFGATIGKALGDLQSGTGIVPVMVTLK